MNVFNEWHSANTSKKIRAVAEERRERENQKAERRAQFSLWLQDKLPFLHRKKDIPDDGQTVDERIHAPVKEEICIDLDEEL